MSKPSSSASESETLPSDAFRTVASLLLCIHLFCIGLAVWANYAPSPLLYNVLQRLEAYTTLFNFNLNYTPYHLTHATEQDVDHRIEILPEGADAAEPDQWLVLPDVGWRGSDRYKRYQRLAEAVSYFAPEEEQAARFAESIAEHFLHAGVQPAQVRTRKHWLLTMQAYNSVTRPDPDAAPLFTAPYTANIVISGDEVEIIGVSETGDVALPAS